MIVVSDTSPLSNLFAVKHLHLLQAIYGKIIVPAEVMQELMVLEKRGFDMSVFRESAWIEVREVTMQSEVNALSKVIDKGEAEAIVLAKELHADWLLMDETKGRAIARQHGLQMVGLLGILLIAKERQLITSVKEVVDAMVEEAKFRISEELYKKVLSLADETGPIQ